MTKIEELESKIHRAIEKIATLQQENLQLKSECQSFKAHISLLNGENTNAQKILGEYDKLRRTREQVTHKVERALQTLNSLRTA